MPSAKPTSGPKSLPDRSAQFSMSEIAWFRHLRGSITYLSQIGFERCKVRLRIQLLDGRFRKNFVAVDFAHGLERNSLLKVFMGELHVQFRPSRKECELFF